MRFLALGVMAPMKNNSFTKSTNFVTDIISTVGASADDENLSLRSVSTYSLLATLGKGDKIKVGASTDTANPRATEEVEVSKVSSEVGDTVTAELESGLLFNYDKKDKVSGFGSYFPDNWAPESASSITAFIGDYFYIPKLNGLNPPDYSGIVTNAIARANLLDFNETGVDDYFCLRLYTDGSNSTSRIMRIARYNFSVGDLLSSTYYRYGIFYRHKITNFAGTGVFVKFTFHDGSTSIVDSDTIFQQTSVGEETNWRLKLGTPAKSGASLTSAGYLEISADFRVASKCFYNFDSVFIEHAKWTDNEEDAVYVFPDQPVVGSQTWNFDEFRQEGILASGGKRYGQQDGRESIQWVFSCRFENISSSFWKNLMILDMWQRLGYRLILHTSEEFGSGSYRVPSILVGIISLKNIQKNSWDRSVKSFQFSFQETK